MIYASLVNNNKIKKIEAKINIYQDNNKLK